MKAAARRRRTVLGGAAGAAIVIVASAGLGACSNGNKTPPVDAVVALEAAPGIEVIRPDLTGPDLPPAPDAFVCTPPAEAGPTDASVPDTSADAGTADAATALDAIPDVLALAEAPRPDSAAMDAGCATGTAFCAANGCTPTAYDDGNCGGLGPCSASTLCVAGSCVAPPTARTVAPNQQSPTVVAVDGTSVYWLTFKSVMKASRDGGCPITIAAATSPASLVVSGGTVYWNTHTAGASGTGQIVACPATGCTASGPATIAATSVDDTVDDAIDVDATNVYWANEISGSVFACRLVGCTTPRAIDSGEVHPRYMRLTGGSLYWTQGSEVSPNDIMTAPTTGTATILVHLLGFDPDLLALANDSSYLYASVDVGQIQRISLVDGSVTTLVGSRPRAIRRVAVDDSSLYWGEYTSTSPAQSYLMKVPLCGGTPRQIGTVSGLVIDHVAVDQSGAFFAAAAVGNGAVVGVTR
jgi:hypothetical protein